MIFRRENETLRVVDPRGKGTRYYRSMWRPNRGLLALAGLALILLSAGLVFLDIRMAGEEAGSPPPKKDTTMELTIPSMRRVKDVPVYTGTAGDKSALHDGTLHLKGTGFPWQRGGERLHRRPQARLPAHQELARVLGPERIEARETGWC